MVSIQTNSYEGRYLKLTVTEESTNISANTSTIKWTLESIGGSANYYTICNCSVIINGQTVYSSGTTNWNTYKFPAAKGSTTGKITVLHNNDGTAPAISFNLHGKVFVDGDDNKTGTLTLSTIPRYATSNQTLSSKTETSITMKWSSDSTCDYIWYSKNNGASWTAVGSVNGSSGSYTITGLSANTTYNIKTRVRRKDSQLTTDSSNASISTYDYPYCNSSPNFIIGNQLTLGFYNPLGRSITVHLIGADGTVKGGDVISGTSLSGYTTDAFINWLYSTIPNSNSGTYQVKVTYGSIVKTRNNSNTYSTNKSNCSPTFNSFSVEDSNDITLSITENDQLFIKGYSKLLISIPSDNKMTTKYNATAIKYVLNCSDLNKTVNYSANDIQEEMGIINSSGIQRVNVIAYDSRTNNILAYKDITVLDYAKPVVNVSATRLNNFENETTIKINGSYTKLTINDTDKNTITSVQYRYRETDGEWSNWVTLNTTLNSGKFTCNDIILSLDNTKSFDFEVQATDKLDIGKGASTIDIGEAIFFISSNEKACYINGQEILMYDVVDEW